MGCRGASGGRQRDWGGQGKNRGVSQGERRPGGLGNAVCMVVARTDKQLAAFTKDTSPTPLSLSLSLSFSQPSPPPYTFESLSRKSRRLRHETFIRGRVLQRGTGAIDPWPRGCTSSTLVQRDTESAVCVCLCVRCCRCDHPVVTDGVFPAGGPCVDANLRGGATYRYRCIHLS